MDRRRQDKACFASIRMWNVHIRMKRKTGKSKEVTSQSQCIRVRAPTSNKDLKNIVGWMSMPNTNSFSSLTSFSSASLPSHQDLWLLFTTLHVCFTFMWFPDLALAFHLSVLRLLNENWKTCLGTRDEQKRRVY